jgi:hypothetical protein
MRPKRGRRTTHKARDVYPIEISKKMLHDKNRGGKNFFRNGGRLRCNEKMT